MEDSILETVIESVPFTMEKDILIKPLEPILIEKVIVKQIPNGKKDEEGNNLYDTKEEKEKVESDFEKGIVIALPNVCPCSATLGDTVIYSKKFAKEFDLYKTSKLIKPYDIVAIEKKK